MKAEGLRLKAEGQTTPGRTKYGVPVAESISIDRINGDEDEYGFECLKREGLRLVQELSGNVWTDYNNHDPGVTILDQICYALTDLIYRTDFPVADFLTADNGQIDFGAQALHPPEEILPCRPATCDDYRKLIFDRLPEISNVWLSRSTDTSGSGLFSIAVRLGPDAARHENEVVEKVRRVYSQARNLCEDLAGITVVKEEECELHARIEVAGGGEPADILAGIYHACSMHIAAGIRPHRLDESLASGLALDELFDGPATGHGIVWDSELDKDGEEILIADLFAVIKGVAGVNNVKRLWLRKGGQDYFDAIENGRETAMLRLYIPAQPEDIGVRLESASGRDLLVPFQEFRTRFNDLDFMHRSLRLSPDDLSAVYPPPHGVRRNLQDYYSIQNQFPAVFGINAYGVPESAPDDVKARAAQLKGYLLLFDQIMANFTANLQQVGKLFAGDQSGCRTYFSQVVENKGNPPLDQIYPKDPAQALTALIHQYDACHDRKSRILDYLLALYGETFPQHTLRNFTKYAAPHESEEALLNAKMAYLRSVLTVGRDRGGAFDYTEDPGNMGNVAGFKQRISLLLGFNDFLHRSLTRSIARHKLHLRAVPADVTTDDGEARFAVVPATIDVEQEFESVPLIIAAKSVGAELLLEECRALLPGLDAVFPEQLLRSGVSLDNFRMAEQRDTGAVSVVFRDEDAGGWRNLALFPDVESAITTINALRRLCIQLNIESEGVHIVEHILLRPMAAPQHRETVDTDFYSFRMSLLFPAWSARCHDSKFREMAEHVVRMNVPAHICPDIYWLDFQSMGRFEQLHKEWLERKCAGSGYAQLDNAACRVIDFLCRYRGADREKGGKPAHG
jgi:hypothetical protein